MSLVDSTREDPESSSAQDAQDGRGDGDASPSPARIEPRSPVIGASWILRAAAIAGVLASIVGAVIAPGLRGNAPGTVVEVTEHASATLAYFMCALLIVLVARGAFEVLKVRRIGMGSRAVAVLGAGVVVSLSMPALSQRLPQTVALVMTGAAVLTCMAGAWGAMLAPHTRAVGAVLAALALAAILRVAAWELASFAGEHASPRLYDVARGCATGAVVLEAIGQLIAAAWLGTRGRLIGQLASSLAIAGAFVVTWGVAHGGHTGSARWEWVVHTALAEAAGVPPPFGLGPIATFLIPSALLLALVAALQPGQVVVVVTALALALLSRGSFDAPLRALAIAAAATWSMLAMADERAMWRALIEDRNRREAQRPVPS